jgi:hypothetical protein
MSPLDRIEDKPQTILLHTLLQEDLTLIAGFRIQKPIWIGLLKIPANPHDIQICTTQLADITQLLDDILLSVNTVARIA